MATERGNLFEPVLVSDLISKVKGKSSLGEEQKKALMEYIRGENGKVSALKMGEAIGDILSGCNQGKNS